MMRSSARPQRIVCWLCWIAAAALAATIAVAGSTPSATAVDRASQQVAEPSTAATAAQQAAPDQAAARAIEPGKDKSTTSGKSTAGKSAAAKKPTSQAAPAPSAPALPDQHGPPLPSRPSLPPLDAHLRRIFAGGVPKNIADLKAMQQRLRQVADNAVAVTVGVRLPSGMGSGVIVSPDGYVLTAGHVVGRPNQDIEIILPEGRRLKARTLGANYGIDSGLIKITNPGKLPYADLGDSSQLHPGQWCLALGHPGGFEKNRTPPLRVGRILEISRSAIVTDCPLVGGDSGGPLFDTDGRVIAIHSRIGNELYANLHVPVDTFRETWDRLAKGEAWGGRRPGGPIIGVIADPTVETARVGDVVEGSPADEAGLKIGDVVTSFDGTPTPTFDSLIAEVAKKEPGDRVELEIRRDGETQTVYLVLGRYGG